MRLTRLPLEALLRVLRHIEGITEKWDTIWNGHFGPMNRVLGIEYVVAMRQLVESIVGGDGKFVGRPDPPAQEKWKVDFVPWTATDGELLLIDNPAKLHFL
jgi:hypothetical protein